MIKSTNMYLIIMKRFLADIKESRSKGGPSTCRIIYLWMIFSMVLMICATPLLADSRFSAEIKTLPKWVISKMKRHSWRKACPVPLDQLSYIYLKHWDNNGKVQFGRLVVHKEVSQDIVEIFESLFNVKFPIAKMKLIDDYQGSDAASMADNNTSAFNCRYVTGRKDVYSKHSYGTAIDINPLVNPFINHRMIAPAEGKKYLDRNASVKGMIKKEDLIYKIFKSKGWIWGGDWKTIKDYQHFQK